MDAAAGADHELLLKEHFISKFGELWLVLRHVLFGSDARLAMPPEWKEQLIASAHERMHLTPEIVEAALEPLRPDEIEAAQVTTLLATGVSHGASMAQGFHLFARQCQQWQLQQQEKEKAGSGEAGSAYQLHLRSISYGAYRWTDEHGAQLFRSLTGCPAPEEASRVSSPVRWSSVAPPDFGGGGGDAVAISMQSSSQHHVVDPIPRIDWRWGLCFRRRGYVNVVEPMGLVAGTGDVVQLGARARQNRLFCCAPCRAEYHLASTYRRAAGKATTLAQTRQKKREAAQHAARRAREGSAPFEPSQGNIFLRARTRLTQVRVARTQSRSKAASEEYAQSPQQDAAVPGSTAQHGRHSGPGGRSSLTSTDHFRHASL